VAAYQGLIGVKNGYTSHAGNTFTGAATRGGRTLLVTVMHPKSGYEAVYEETAALLDWGFAAAGKADPVGTLVTPLSEQPKGAAAAKPGAGAAGAAGAPVAASATSHTDDWAFGGSAAVALLAGGGLLALRRRGRERPSGRRRRQG
jgi:D-alanyl-D-alanine carboxypeptidase (penicillin-binding protein 5/6)